MAFQQRQSSRLPRNAYDVKHAAMATALTERNSFIDLTRTPLRTASESDWAVPDARKQHRRLFLSGHRC